MLEIVWLVLAATSVGDTVTPEVEDTGASEVAETVASIVEAVLLSTDVVESAEDAEMTSTDVALVATESSLDVVATGSLLTATVSVVALALVTTSELAATDVS